MQKNVGERGGYRGKGGLISGWQNKSIYWANNAVLWHFQNSQKKQKRSKSKDWVCLINFVKTKIA